LGAIFLFVFLEFDCSIFDIGQFAVRAVLVIQKEETALTVAFCAALRVFMPRDFYESI